MLGILFDGGSDKHLAEFLGDLNEDVNTEHKCSLEMDLHNNRVGRNLAPSRQQMVKWLSESDYDISYVHQKLSEIVASAVKSSETINSLSDKRMSKKCQEKYAKNNPEDKPGQQPKQAIKKEGAYIWRTQSDGKVRPEHAMLDGQIFNWDNPPSVGHPRGGIWLQVYSRASQRQYRIPK